MLLDIDMSLMAPPLPPRNDDRPALARALDRYRQEQGWSQKEMAEHLGLSPSRLNAWLTGTNTPSIETWAEIEDHESLQRGYFFARAGLVQMPTTLENMVRFDPDLDERAADFILGVIAGQKQLLQKKREQHQDDES